MRSVLRWILGGSLGAAALFGTVVPSFGSSPTGIDFEDLAPGTVVVKTSQRRLYVHLGDGRTRTYTVGVGRVSQQWTGKTFINGKHLSPAWSPPAVIRRDKPSLPDVIPGGSRSNPMGLAALTLNGGEYAIHGTNEPKSIGGFVSYGCIRMHNRDIMDLYSLVRVGTPVIVVP